MKFKCLSDEPNTNEMKMLTVGKIYEGIRRPAQLFASEDKIFIRECDDGYSGEFRPKFFEIVEEG